MKGTNQRAAVTSHNSNANVASEEQLLIYRRNVCQTDFAIQNVLNYFSSMRECDEHSTCRSELIPLLVPVHFHLLANQELATQPTVTWAGLLTGHAKFSEVGRWSGGTLRGSMAG